MLATNTHGMTGTNKENVQLGRGQWFILKKQSKWTKKLNLNRRVQAHIASEKRKKEQHQKWESRDKINANFYALLLAHFLPQIGSKFAGSAWASLFTFCTP